MLRFLRDHLYIGVEHRQVSLVRLRGRSRTVVDTDLVPLDDGALAASTLEVLESKLHDPRWQKTQVQVVLSDALSRYFVAPIPSGARNLRELRDAASIRFGEIFGDDSRAWTIELDLSPGASHHLGCAIPTRLSKGLRSCIQNAGLPLMGMVPFGISEFNRHHRHIANRSGWFVAVTDKTLWTAYKSGSSWLVTQCGYRDEDSLMTLPQRLAQAQLRLGVSPVSGQHFWITGIDAGCAAFQPLSAAGARCLDAPRWSGQDQHWSDTYRLALSPVWPRCN